MKKVKILTLFLILGFIGCQDRTSVKVEVKNDVDYNTSDNLVKIKISKLSQFNVKKLAAFDGDEEIPSQLVDSNADGKMDNFTFLVNLNANQTKIISLSETTNKKIFPKRAHAEISEKRDYKLIDGVYTGGKFVSVKRTKIPEGHIDHNLYYKCEGPCWESDKVAYRFYIDQRNATDIFGKKVSEIILPKVGHTYDKYGNETYHTMADWGMDIFKVGNSLGIGSFAAFVKNKVEMITVRDSVIAMVTNDGPIFASIKTNYYGWHIDDKKIDVETNLSIVAGSRLTKCEAVVGDENLLYCTGLAKHEGTELLKSSNNNGWNYIALWGEQSLVPDNLGIAIFYNKDFEPSIKEDKLSYIVTLSPNNGKIEYYFVACWEHELNGVKKRNKFLSYLNQEIIKLGNSIKIIK